MPGNEPNSIETKSGVLIVTHRTPRVIAEVVRVFFLYFCQLDANHSLRITFEERPINDARVVDDSE